ncbi:lysosomal alpha-glucosidase-like isoform X3 [Dermacentor albipictus]|uniref:lysosomal alpha-glucosidase-like isoform X3 n=1 Tax=Dermacentor albipictus TaxID=60249 RepID=UPI0038FD1F28
MALTLKSAALSLVRRRLVIRRCLPLLCLVPLAVLTLRIFSANPERRQEIPNARFLEELKSFTGGPVKQEITIPPKSNAANDAKADLDTVCSALSKQKGLVECPPHIGTDAQDCRRRGCCWIARAGQPAGCFMPPSYRRYVVFDSDVTSTSSRLSLNRSDRPAPGESATVTVDITRVTYDTIRIRIRDRSRREFVPPVPAIEGEYVDLSLPCGYTARLSDKNILSVVAKETRRVLVEFDLPRMYYTERDKYVTLRPKARFAYGIRSTPSTRPFLDLSADSARHLFYAGSGSTKNRAVKGTYLADHPFLLLASAAEGTAHGVYLHNANEIELVTSPRGTLTFRVDGGQLDFFVFGGPTPQSVLEQYHGLVGRPSMPSVHTLLHSVPSGGPVRLDAVVTNAHLARAVHRLGLYKLKQNLTVTITPQVVIQESTGKRPYTCYDKNNKAVYFVDFTHPMAQQHWYETLRIAKISEGVNDTFDYVLLEGPRCKIRGSLTPECPHSPTDVATPTDQICGTARLHLSTYADLRNAYPYMLAEMTHRYRTMETSQRQKLLSDVTFAGQGKWSGYWRPQAPRNWAELGDTLAEMLTFGMLGVHLYGVGACHLESVTREAEAELCLRWFSLSVFFPVHQTLGQATTPIQRRVAALASRATALRHFLLPYVYTQLVKASRSGGTLARPTYIDFPRDPKTHAYPKQFMFGPSLLVTPQIETVRAASLLEVYFPAGRWYDWYNSKRVESRGQAVFVPSPNATAAMFTRGGTIIAGRALNRSVTNIHLIVSPDNSDYAYGELISDNGVNAGTFDAGIYSVFHFSYMKGILTGHCSVCRWGTMLRAATVFGVPGPAPVRVQLNERPLKFAFARSTLYLFDIGHNLRKPFAITVGRL